MPNNFLNTLPTYDELVQITTKMVNYSDVEKEDRNLTVDDSDDTTFVRWVDGAGNEGNLILFKHTPNVLLYGYDHESENNFFGEDIETVKQEQVVFDNIPPVYDEFIQSGKLVWDWADDNFVYATCAFWLEDNKWVTNQEVLTESLVDEASYCLEPFINNEEWENEQD